MRRKLKTFWKEHITLYWKTDHKLAFWIVLIQGCARFTEILQNCVVRQVLGRMCSIVFLAFTLKLAI